METLTPLVKALFGAGILGFIASLLTWYSSTRKNRSDAEIALRRLENEEDEAFRKRELELRTRENAMYEKQIAELKAENERLLRAELERQMKAEEAKRQHGRRN